MYFPLFLEPTPFKEGEWIRLFSCFLTDEWYKLGVFLKWVFPYRCGTLTESAIFYFILLNAGLT